jgi:hypothetical protein
MSNIESIESLPNLSEFFGELSKEKKRAHKEIKERVADPTTGLSNLFKQLDEAHKETLQKQEMVSSDPVVKKTESSGLSIDDQNKLEIFSNLVDTMNATVEPTVTVAESTNDIEFLSEPTELLQDNTFERTGDIIEDIVNSLDELGLKTKISEEVDQITTLRKEFDNFRSLVAQQIASSQMSGAGSGETRLEFLDDVDRATAKVNDKALVYSSSDGKWKGETILTGVITGLDIDGGTDIGAALADADLFIVDDGAGGTNRKTAASRIKTYVADITLTTAAQTNITSLGTLSALQVDNININGNAITSTAGTDLTITPLSGQQIVLDSAIVVDAGVVTGATSITSTAFVGDITGDVTGNVSGTAATVTAAAQTNITSVGTLTALTVDNIVINGTNIGHTSDTDALAIDSSGNVTASQNLIVSGDFTVNGTTTTISSTNTVVADNLFELNNGAGSNSNDSGIIIERGSTGDNAIIMWDESADKFQVGTTSATASATGNLSVTSGILVASSFEGDLASAVIENSGQITSDSFNLPITLNGTNGSNANAGDNIVQDTAANANDRIVYEDATPTHYERPITWDRTT